jgi:FdrA protein
MSEVTNHVEVRRGVYLDSVTLLGVSQDVQRVDGVDQALVAMATPLNLELLRDLGFDGPKPDDATPNDLVIAVRATEDALGPALERMEQAFTGQPAGERSEIVDQVPHTVGAAARHGDAGLALISVPGPNAFVEAIDALRAGMHVMVFSDNVPVEQEIALKSEGARRGLLVMGPDCGTAIIGGVGLGFANVVRPGPVGVVAASGTGAQQVCCLLDDAGIGCSHVIGVGGRDLSAQVGAASTLQALEALDDDPDTALILLVSKPPDPAVADRVQERIAACATPVVLGFVGLERPDLTTATFDAIARLGQPVREPRRWEPPEPPAGGAASLRGLFSGGTLCDEAMVIAADVLGPIASNIPLVPEWRLDDLRVRASASEPAGGDLGDADGHVMIDFGDDALTRGRPHPMIDHSLRLAQLERESLRPGNHVVLLDVVLGHAADANPAAVLAPAIHAAQQRAAARGDRLAVVVSLCGTRGDPQDLDRQAHRLAAAGAIVHLSNAYAAREAVGLVMGGVA